MRTSHLLVLLVALTVALAASLSARPAAAQCCAHCGCHQKCQKVCRLVYEEKKVEIVCWGCKCEEFCLPKPSKCCGKNCETVCETCGDKCDCSDVHSKPKRFVWRDWSPSCAHQYTKKKLMKKIEVKKIPAYKWVVEDVCEKCESKFENMELQSDAEIPPPPVGHAKIISGKPVLATPVSQQEVVIEE